MDLARVRAVSSRRQFPRIAAHLLLYHGAFLGLPFASSRATTVGTGVNGRDLRLAIRRNASDWHVYREIFLENALQDVTGEWLGRAETVVDFGSNIGLASVYLSCWATDARFYCVDPAAENNAVAARNFAANGIEAVVEQLAISDRDGRIPFYPNRWWASSSTVKSVVDARTGRAARFESALVLPPVEVESITVSSFIRRHGLRSIDLMKIDVEGAEQQIMQGDTGWLDIVDTVVVEIHRKYIDAGPVISAFGRHGMRRRQTNGHLSLFRR
ncbi:FkbM family methyltransferase [Phytohabitans sp. LJ34]|uniref:FkbM family methyltransferase n=1 Tax=Phytohabitans sp. LJ34 TaxID=3452217 RepID=UPI003F8CCEA6